MMLFKDIKQNYPVYILDKQEMTFKQGKVTNVSLPTIPKMTMQVVYLLIPTSNHNLYDTFQPYPITLIGFTYNLAGNIEIMQQASFLTSYTIMIYSVKIKSFFHIFFYFYFYRLYICTCRLFSVCIG